MNHLAVQNAAGRRFNNVNCPWVIDFCFADKFQRTQSDNMEDKRILRDRKSIGVLELGLREERDIVNDNLVHAVNQYFINSL